MSRVGGRLAGVLSDLEAEGDRLEALVAPLDEEGWRTATPAIGWDVAHQVVHLAWTDECAVAAATDKQAWDALVMQAIEDPEGFVDTEAAKGARASGAEILVRWRAARAALQTTLREVPDDTRIPWYGPPMSATSMATARYMETWAHGRDVAAALGAALPVDDGLRHVVHLGVRTRDFAFHTREMQPPAQEFRVSLVLPSGEVVVYGPEDAAQSVTGSAHDFALLVTQRINRADTALVAEGDDADAWLDVAQAFAGPPGDGRAPQESMPA
jgi:uncharacterized protein (TIGR03084 family)